MKLFHQQKQQIITTWLKCYSIKDRKLWKGEMRFYETMKLQNLEIDNAMKCLWLRKGHNYVIDSNGFGIKFTNKL